MLQMVCVGYMSSKQLITGGSSGSTNPYHSHNRTPPFLYWAGFVSEYTFEVDAQPTVPMTATPRLWRVRGHSRQSCRLDFESIFTSETMPSILLIGVRKP